MASTVLRCRFKQNVAALAFVILSRLRQFKQTLSNNFMISRRKHREKINLLHWKNVETMQMLWKKLWHHIVVHCLRIPPVNAGKQSSDPGPGRSCMPCAAIKPYVTQLLEYQEHVPAAEKPLYEKHHTAERSPSLQLTYAHRWRL